MQERHRPVGPVSVAFLLPAPDGMNTVGKLLCAQSLAGLLVVGIAGLWRGSGPAVAALAGTLIGVVPHAFLAARVLAPRAARDARSLLRAGWVGALGQLAISAVLFAAAFTVLRPLYAGWLFAGLIAGQVAWPLVLAVTGRADRQS